MAEHTIPIVGSGPIPTPSLHYSKPENWHDAAKIFPLMAEKELNELSLDIKKNGLLNPVVLYENKVLDGRNRVLACAKIGIEPAFVEWAGSGSPVSWSLSQNVYRRNLSSLEESLAFKTSGAEPAGVKTRHLYKALLKCEDSTLVHDIIDGLRSKTLKQADALSALKSGKTRPEDTHPLLKKLSPLLPAIGDGTEHSLIVMLQSDFEGSDEIRRAVVDMLRRISKDFAEYAERIENGISG